MNDWSLVTVEDGLTAIIDYRGKTPPKSPTGIPLISAANVKKGRVVFNKPEYISPEDYERWTTRGFTQSGDVLITTEAPVGEVAPYPKAGTFQISRRVMALRVDEKLLHHGFLLYALQSRPIQAELIGRNRGTTVPRVLKTDITGLRILAPALEEQRRIAAILGALDDKIELNRKMNRTLEEIAQTIFNSWFIDFDGVPHEDLVDSEVGPIPGDWNVEALDEVADYLNGTACQKYPASPDETSLPVIKIRELNQGVTQGSDRATVAIPDKWRIADGDVLFSWSGSLVVKVWTGGPGVLNQHLFKVTSETHPRWLYLMWTRHHLREFQRIAADKATTMGHIKRRHLTEAKCVIPPAGIIEKANTLLGPLVERQVVNDLESRSLAALRDTLLPKLISGELRVPKTEGLEATA